MDEVLRAMNEENERLMKQFKEGWSESLGSLFINNVGFDLHRMRTIGYRPHTYDCLFTQAGGEYLHVISHMGRPISSLPGPVETC